MREIIEKWQGKSTKWVSSMASLYNYWQRWRVLVILLLHRRITPAVLSIFSPKKTRCLSHNRRRSEGLILLSQTTRIKLWRRLFLQWQDFRTAWTFARMKFLRSNGFFVKWHLSFCFVDMARTCKSVSGSAFYEPAFWTNKYRFKKKSDFQMDVIKYDFRPNCTPLSSITIINGIKLKVWLCRTKWSAIQWVHINIMWVN